MFNYRANNLFKLQSHFNPYKISFSSLRVNTSTNYVATSFLLRSSVCRSDRSPWNLRSKCLLFWVVNFGTRWFLTFIFLERKRNFRVPSKFRAFINFGKIEQANILFEPLPTLLKTNVKTTLNSKKSMASKPSTPHLVQSDIYGIYHIVSLKLDFKRTWERREWGET